MSSIANFVAGTAPWLVASALLIGSPLLLIAAMCMWLVTKENNASAARTWARTLLIIAVISALLGVAELLAWPVRQLSDRPYAFRNEAGRCLTLTRNGDVTIDRCSEQPAWRLIGYGGPISPQRYIIFHVEGDPHHRERHCLAYAKNILVDCPSRYSNLNDPRWWITRPDRTGEAFGISPASEQKYCLEQDGVNNYAFWTCDVRQFWR